MPQTRSLRRYSEPTLRRRLLTAAQRLGHENVFNPSPARLGSSTWVAYRALPRGATKPFRAFLAELPDEGEDRVTSLTREGSPEREVVADPKLLILHDELYVSYNTGYIPAAQGNNALYLGRVEGGGLGVVQRCELDGRQRIEKNWAFYAGRDGRLGALYTAEPLHDLALTSGEIGTAGPLRFAMRGGMPLTASPPRLTLGTQLLPMDGYHLAIVHEKRAHGDLRSYRGRAARVFGLGDAAARVEVSPIRLIHARHSMRRQRSPHNPALHSATYFSGIAMREGRLIVGYGVNDRDARFATISEEKLWN